MTTFATTVQGIPCQCRVTHYSPVIPAQLYGPPENCYPEEGGELDFELLDRKGNRAHWLEAKMSPKDEARIKEEAAVFIEGELQALAYDAPEDSFNYF
jgi:hypothetical protein